MSTPAILENGHNTKRSALTLHGFPLAVLTYQTLGLFIPTHSFDIQLKWRPGIIYSDIGTSPLYVLNGLWPASGDVPSEENIIGGISAIIWFLTILPLIKYV
jgi:KUP system potassium uptake protein